MIWQSEPIATWSASVPLNASGNIITNNTTAATEFKTFTVKGQNPNTTTEPDFHGNIGNAFVDIFGIGYLQNITRKTPQNLNYED